MEKTIKQYNQASAICRNLFINKLEDYGAAWRILRTTSLTDQIFIKASRIREIEIKQTTKVDEGILPEYIGIINYSIIALIQLELGYSDTLDITAKKAIEMYDKYIIEARELMTRKNHDYGEAWRLMRISSYTDLILMKLYRTKQIEDNAGKTIVSEGIDANYFDMINYAVFALIKLDE